MRFLFRVEDAKSLLHAARRHGVTDLFVWLASDGWGQQEAPVKDGNDFVAEGALTIELQSSYMPEFDSYFQSLSPHDNSRNPWFVEFWKATHGCTFQNSTSHTTINTNNVTESHRDRSHRTLIPHRLQSEYGSTEQTTTATSAAVNLPYCTGRESWGRHNYKQESKVLFVYNAVYAMAYALDAMIKDACPMLEERLSCIKNTTFDGSVFYQEYILNVSFTGKIIFKTKL